MAETKIHDVSREQGRITLRSSAEIGIVGQNRNRCQVPPPASCRQSTGVRGSWRDAGEARFLLSPFSSPLPFSLPSHHPPLSSPLRTHTHHTHHTHHHHPTPTPRHTTPHHTTPHHPPSPPSPSIPSLPSSLLLCCSGGDSRGVHDTLARSSSSCLGLKDKKYGLGVIALKQSLVECGTMIRWCHSAAQLGDVVTKDSDTARTPWELFVRRGFRRKTILDPKFESSRNRAKRGLDILAEPDEDEFAADIPRGPKSATLST